jgi:L-fucose isomerase-like protein
MSSHYRNTVNDPSYVTAGASHDRLELAHEANVLDMALDAAETSQAANSLEMMMAHQLAAAHRSAMKLDAQLNHQAGRLNGVISPAGLTTINVEVARLANSTARMTGAFQQGLLTMQRLKSGGRQVVTVQRVTVEQGGQAVVAGQVTGGKRGGRSPKRQGGKSENGQ